jgi:hypothetical protein
MPSTDGQGEAERKPLTPISSLRADMMRTYSERRPFGDMDVEVGVGDGVEITARTSPKCPDTLTTRRQVARSGRA